MDLGAYAVERDYSHYVAYAAKTVFAVVGTASKGPIGVPVLCTSTQDLVNKFGPLNPSHYALYAGQYFLSQSSKLYFVRAAHGGDDGSAASAATLNLKGSNSEGEENLTAITLEALEKGTYYNGFGVGVLVDNPSEVDKSKLTYTISVYNKLGSVLDTIKSITLAELSTGYTSKYFRVSSVAESIVQLTPTRESTNVKDQPYIFSEGDDGSAAIDSGDYISAANTLAAEQIDMNLFAVPGVSDSAVITAMLTLAETRGDCLYLVDPPKDLDRDGVVNWHNGGEGYQDGTRLNSSYGALYYDWVTIYDPMNKTNVVVPPSVVVAATYAYSDRTTEVWYAPAGLNRGVIRGVLNTVTSLSKADTRVLYSDDNAINSIYEDPQVGLVLWGQKTLSRANTSLNRINVRRMLNYLKKIVTAACNYLTFDPNDRITWNSFEMKVLPVLRNLQNKRGIYDYRVIKGETIVTAEDIDNYRMPCMIMIRPTKAAEEIPIYFTITSTGADFNDVLASNGVVTE